MSKTGLESKIQSKLEGRAVRGRVGRRERERGRKKGELPTAASGSPQWKASRGPLCHLLSPVYVTQQSPSGFTWEKVGHTLPPPSSWLAWAQG